MKLTLKNVLISSVVVALIGFALAMSIDALRAYALTGNLSTNQSVSANSFRHYEFFASTTNNAITATTTTATSTNITPFIDSNGRVDNGWMDVRGAKAVTLYFSRAVTTDNTVGSSTFRIQTTRDGSTWVDYNKLISNVTNTNGQMLTRVGQSAITLATSTSMFSMDVGDAFMGIRCIKLEATTGEGSCSASAKYYTQFPLVGLSEIIKTNSIT